MAVGITIYGTWHHHLIHLYPSLVLLFVHPKVTATAVCYHLLASLAAECPHQLLFREDKQLSIYVHENHSQLKWTPPLPAFTHSWLTFLFWGSCTHHSAICVHCNHLKVTTDYWLPFYDIEVYLMWFMSWFIEEQSIKDKAMSSSSLLVGKSFCAKKVAKPCSVMCFWSVWVYMHAHSELVLQWHWVMSLVPWQGKECAVCAVWQKSWCWSWGSRINPRSLIWPGRRPLLTLSLKHASTVNAVKRLAPNIY